MNRMWKHVWLAALAAAVMFAPLAPATAQNAQSKPFAVVSVASVDKLLGDVDYLTRVSANPEYGRLAAFMVGPYVTGIDRAKPAGAYVSMDGEEPVVIAFVPVTDLTAVLDLLKESVGEPKDVGGGVQQIGEAPMAAFIKLEGTYAFVARDAAHLTNLPKDPVALLGGLDKTYSIAARLDMQNVPAAQKKQLIDAFKEGFESAPIPDEAGQRELLEKIRANSSKQITDALEESDQITIGWAIDPMMKATYIDILYTALPNTNLAKTMATLKDAKTDYAGFVREDAPFSLSLTTQGASPEDIQQGVTLIEGFRDAILNELENDEELEDEEEREAAQELVNDAFDVLLATVKEGKMDAGALVLTEPQSLTFVAGGRVVDAAKLEAAFKKAIEFGQKKKPEEFEDVEVKFNAGTHAGLRLHQLKFPVKDADAQKVFGEKLNMILAVGDKSVYAAFGSKADATLKSVVDKSAAEAGKAVLPMQMTIALGPIMKFAASVDDNPITASFAKVADKVKGNDRIRVTGEAIENGQRARYLIDEGVIRIIGEGFKNAQAASNDDF